MYKLIIQDDEGKTIVVPLIRDEFTIGRKEGNTIRLTERNVSRKHARIVKSDGSVVVEDLDSYNGVKVNGTRIQGRVAVKESDRIQIGDYLLELKLDRGAQAGDATATPSSPELQPLPPGAVAAHTPTPVLGNNGQALQMRATKPTAPLGPQYDSQPPSQPPPPVVASVATNPGRLVVVSSNFSGREFILSKPTMVIGRTDDNDVVVNHRSISRHHAKVVLEAGRYCIVDMQSSNGVRVNGEEYGKVELRRGDVVDLGHVRLRYVEPGEDFVFERDAQVVDIAAKPGKAKGVAIALLSVAVLGGAAAVFLFTTRNGTGGAVASAPAEPPKATPPVEAAAKPPDPTPAKPAEPPTPTPAVAVAAAADAGAGAGEVAMAPTEPPKPVEPAPPSPKDESEKLLADAKEAMGSQEWLKAYAAAEKALVADPGNAEAKKLGDQAHAELASQQIFKKFGDARDANKPADALKILGQIPKDSMYREKAEADVPALHTAFVKEREAEARTLAGRGQCDRIAGLARRSAEVFPDAKAAVEKAGARCVAQAASPQPSDGETTTAGAGNVDQLIADAREAARNANWIEARKKADEVLRSSPDNQDALSVAGVAACNLADKDRAQKYMSRLKGARQNMMKQICASRGVMME